MQCFFLKISRSFVCFWCYKYPNVFMDFLHILLGQSFRLQSFRFCLKPFKLFAFLKFSWQVIPEDYSNCTNSLKTKICSLLCFVYLQWHNTLDFFTPKGRRKVHFYCICFRWQMFYIFLMNRNQFVKIQQ